MPVAYDHVTLHRDRSVTLYDDATDRRVHTTRPTPEQIASLDPETAARVECHLRGWRLTARWTTVGDAYPYSPVTHDDGRAAGGCVYHQIRLYRGQLQRRRVAANQGSYAYGEPEACEASDVLR